MNWTSTAPPDGSALNPGNPVCNGERVCWFIAIQLNTQSMCPGDSLAITYQGNQYVFFADTAFEPPYYVALTLCGTLISQGKELAPVVELVKQAERLAPPLTCLSCLASVVAQGEQYRRWNERNRP